MKALSNFKTRFVRAVALALVGVLAPMSTRGYSFQAINFVPSNTQAIYNATVYRSIVRNSRSGRTSSTRSSTSNATQPSKQAIRLNFRSNPAISRQVQSTIVEAVRKQAPSEADRLASILASGQPMQLYSQAAAAYGLKPDDVADVLTAHILMQWLVANDVQTQPSRASVQAVRSQIAEIAANNPQFQSEQTRQTVAEYLIYQFMFLNASWHQLIATGNAAQIQQLAQTTNQSSLNQLGLDLRKIELTEAGFRPRS